MPELPGRASPVAPMIEDSNIQNRYSIVPVKMAARVNYPSYASTGQHESAVLPTWKTSRVGILSNDPISPMLLHAPISPFALSNGRPPVQDGNTSFGRQISALVVYNELARTTNVPVARNYLPRGRVNAPIRPNEAPRQTTGSTMPPLVAPNIVEGASDGSLTGSSEFELARKYERGVPRPTSIPGSLMAPSGGTSTNVVDMTDNDPHPVMKPRGIPAEAFEGDILKLKERLLRKGAEPTAVGVCTRIFSEGISIAALEGPMTREESEEHGVIGKRYRMLLKRSMESGGIKNRCRLCSEKGSVEYKNHRDALRHLLKDHFGMGYECKHNWYVWC